MAAKFTSRISWRDKLEKAREPRLVRVPVRMQKRFGAGTMLIPRPLDVDSLMRRVRRGRLVTQSQIRAKLAEYFGADVTCPVTTGIFVRIAAEAAEEDRRHGRSPITPYWRVVRDNGDLIEKLPGGPAAQARRLRREGVAVETPRRHAARVRDFQRYLTHL